MLLKRHFKLPENWAPVRNIRDGATGALKDVKKPEGALLNPPPLDYVELRHTGTNPEQNFSTGLVEAGLAEGWISIGQGKLTLRAKPEDLVYAIKRGPGHYCCHCGERIPDANQFLPGQQGEVTVGMRHVAEAHPNTPSPDPSNPAGYCRVNSYECVLDEKTHAKFRFKRTGRAR